MTDQKDIALDFDLTGATPPQECKFLLHDATTIEERNATPMPARAKESGELTRIYNFALNAGAPLIELSGRDGDPGQRVAFLTLEDVDKTTLTKAHGKLTALGGMPPALDLCLDPAKRQRLRDDEAQAQASLRKWSRLFSVGGGY